MPDLSRRVRCDGKTYAWDGETKQIVEIKITDIPIKDCPEDVIIALMGKGDKKHGD
jgi:hypothetical protein